MKMNTRYIVTYHVPVTRRFCCSLLLRFVVVVVRIYLFGVDDFCTCSCCLHYTSNWYHGTRYQVHILHYEQLVAKTKARKSPPRELGYISTSYQDNPPQESPGLLPFWIAYLGFCCCLCVVRNDLGVDRFLHLLLFTLYE